MYLSRVRLHDNISGTQLPLLLKDRQGYGLHRLFWDLFSEGKGDKKRRDFLFREEIASEQLGQAGRRKGMPIYYVLSKQIPMKDSPLFEVETKVYQPSLSVGERVGFKLRVNAVVSREGKRHDIVMDEQRSWLREQLNEMGVTTEGAKNVLKNRLLDRSGDAQLALWVKLIESGRYADELTQSLGRTEILDWTIKTLIEKRIQKWWISKGERLGFEVPMDDSGEPLIDAVSYRKHALPEKALSAGFNSLDLSGEVVISNVEQFKKSLFDGIGPSKAFGCGLMMIRRL